MRFQSVSFILRAKLKCRIDVVPGNRVEKLRENRFIVGAPLLILMVCLERQVVCDVLGQMTNKIVNNVVY